MKSFGPSYRAGSPADLKWGNQCLADNKGATTDAIIRKYCICMNEKMDSNETRSISQWEKANPGPRRLRQGIGLQVSPRI